MNTINKNSIIQLIVAGTSFLFMLLGLIFNIVIKVDGWQWTTSLILFLAPLSVFVFSILEIVMPGVINPFYYLSVFAIMILQEFILTIRYMISMAESKYDKADYFVLIVSTLVAIAVIIIALISSIKYDKMFVPFVVSVTYIACDYFQKTIFDFIRFWGYLFGGKKVRYVFWDFSYAIAMFLTLGVLVYVIHTTNKKAQ